MIYVLVLCAGCGRQKISQTGTKYENTDTQASDYVRIDTKECENKSKDITESLENLPIETTYWVEEGREEAENQQIVREQFDLRIEEWLNQLTIEEKAAQLFVILPEVFSFYDCVTFVDESMRQSIREIPVGGFIFLEQNLISAEQTKEMLAELQGLETQRIGLPVFLCVDEEGGSVTRIGGRENFDVPYVGDMSDIGATQNIENAYEAGNTIGQYLSELGLNVNFAPVADVWSNPENQVVRYRSFGTDTKLVADMCAAFSGGLQQWNIYAVWKHFPGHGATAADTHQGYAYTNKTLQELQLCELVPFQRGIEEGIKFIMAGHISLPNVTGDHTPASLSGIMLNQILREQMGYDGIIITDAMNMGAIVQNFDSAEAAVQAILAGADMILMPADFYSAYQGVLEAVGNQQITIERLDESVRRILKVKLNYVFP